MKKIVLNVFCVLALGATAFALSNYNTCSCNGHKCCCKCGADCNCPTCK